MKAWGVDGFSRRDLLEGMMAGQDPFLFIHLLEGANERSKGRVDRWIRSRWKDSEGKEHWGDTPLTEVTKDNMSGLHKVEGPRLWMPRQPQWRRLWSSSMRTEWLTRNGYMCSWSVD